MLQWTEKVFTFERSEFLPLPPDKLWKIERGVVRTITWNEDGVLVSLGYWGCGDIVGQPLSRLVTHKIECLTEVECILLPSHLWCQVIDAIISHIQQTEELLNIIHIRPTHLRLWEFLGWLSRKFGRKVEQGRMIDLRLTHQQISEATGMTRVTVTRLISKFQKSGIIVRDRQRLVVLN